MHNYYILAFYNFYIAVRLYFHGKDTNTTTKHNDKPKPEH